MGFPLDSAKYLRYHAMKMREFATGDFSRLGAYGRKQKSAEVRGISAMATAAIVPMPIPFADIWTITPLQMLMVIAIGNIHGFKLSKNTVKEVFAVVGGGWLGKQLCLALFKIGLPGVGGFGGAAFAYCWTHAMGRTAEAYFQSGMKASRDQMRTMMKEEMKKDTDAVPLPYAEEPTPANLCRYQD